VKTPAKAAAKAAGKTPQEYELRRAQEVAVAQDVDDASTLTLRLADGRGLIPQKGWTFDHPNGSGLQCHNINIEVGAGDRAASVRLDGPADWCTLLLEAHGAALHVSHGPPGPNVANSRVIFHANAPAGVAPLQPAGDKWQLDRQQGTLSPCANKALVLGLTSGKYVGLVQRGSPTAFTFAVKTPAKAAAKAAGKRKGNCVTVKPGVGTLQKAVNRAPDGGELVLSDGTYHGSGSHVLSITKSITIRALHAGRAVLDGEEARCVVKTSNGAAVELDGLKITRGKGQINGQGGGICQHGGKITFTNCEICNNKVNEKTAQGGAIFALGGALVVSNCRIHSNIAHGGQYNQGAGIWLKDCTLTMSGSTLDDNKADQGAGIWLMTSTLTMSSSTLRDNKADNATVLFIHKKSTATLDEGCLVDGSVKGKYVVTTTDASRGTTTTTDDDDNAASSWWSHLTGSPQAPIQVLQPVTVAGAQEVIPMGIVLDGMGQEKTALIEQVEVLKRELGLSGTVSEVVHQAAEQLGVAAEGKAIAALAAACIGALRG
jgi:hypothetical protein